MNVTYARGGFKFEIGLRGIHLYPLVYTLTVYKKITLYLGASREQQKTITLVI